MTQNKKFRVGDSVKDKDGTKDPDFGIDIGGWQGRVSEIDKDLICIVWDSITLSAFPDKYISQCEEEGLDWERIYLEKKDVKLVAPRDTKNEVINKQKKTISEHRYDYLGESGKRITNVLKHIDPDDDLAAFEAWEKYLQESLAFPFDAEISDNQIRGLLQQGDKIRVHSIRGNDDLAGVIVKLRYGRKVYHHPLGFIEALDEKTMNYQLVKDYAVWFANR